MVAKQRRYVAPTHAGKTVTVVIEDTVFRVPQRCRGARPLTHDPETRHPLQGIRARRTDAQPSVK
jgi:hypothetical protein